jgi:hypothetical protein
MAKPPGIIPFTNSTKFTFHIASAFGGYMADEQHQLQQISGPEERAARRNLDARINGHDIGPRGGNPEQLLFFVVEVTRSSPHAVLRAANSKDRPYHGWKGWVT